MNQHSILHTGIIAWELKQKVMWRLIYVYCLIQIEEAITIQSLGIQQNERVDFGVSRDETANRPIQFNIITSLSADKKWMKI